MKFTIGATILLLLVFKTSDARPSSFDTILGDYIIRSLGMLMDPAIKQHLARGTEYEKWAENARFSYKHLKGANSEFVVVSKGKIATPGGGTEFRMGEIWNIFLNKFCTPDQATEYQDKLGSPGGSLLFQAFAGKIRMLKDEGRLKSSTFRDKMLLSEAAYIPNSLLVV